MALVGNRNRMLEQIVLKTQKEQEKATNLFWTTKIDDRIKAWNALMSPIVDLEFEKTKIAVLEELGGLLKEVDM
jgi:hypothetical protein